MRTQIIAEIGANHGGDVKLAEVMIAAAADCGADYVKFQSWQARNLKPGDPNFERHSLAELSDDAHRRLIDVCRAHNVKFLTTCFDHGRVDFLASLGLESIKVASPDCGSVSMIRRLRERFAHVIVSTGMTDADEVIRTGELLRGTPFTFMHCVSIYPTPPDKVNLKRMEWLRQFTPSVGYSDHSNGTAAAKAAIAFGATFIEKHFTISRYLPGKDQAVSCEPSELREVCAYAREVETLMGSGGLALSEGETKLRDVYVGKWGDNRREAV